MDKDKSQKLSFKVSGGKVKKWKAVIYASCFSGNQLTTRHDPRHEDQGGGKFSRKYQPVPESETFVTVKGKVSGGEGQRDRGGDRRLLVREAEVERQEEVGG